MILGDFPCLTDENIHADVVAYLRQRGMDVADVRELGLHGTDDLDLIRLSYSEGRIVLTHDADFGALAIAQMEPLVGIVFLRPGHIRPEFTIQSLEVVFTQATALNSPFILVARRTGNHVAIRIRSL